MGASQVDAGSGGVMLLQLQVVGRHPDSEALAVAGAWWWCCGCGVEVVPRRVVRGGEVDGAGMDRPCPSSDWKLARRCAR